MRLEDELRELQVAVIRAQSTLLRELLESARGIGVHRPATQIAVDIQGTVAVWQALENVGGSGRRFGAENLHDVAPAIERYFAAPKAPK